MRIDFEVPDTILQELLDDVPLPEMLRLRYRMHTPAPLAHVGTAIMEAMQLAGVQESFRAGERIAIGVGSRGIGQLPDIVSALVRSLRSLGVDPFVVPAMGSHGGATAVGQQAVLAHLGITAERIGAPVESSMDVDLVGQTDAGEPVYIDRCAHAADGVVFVARIKPHTAYRGRYESGMAKMVAIGLGKQAGAAATHARGFGEMARMVPEMAAIALERVSIRLGIAVLENAYDQPFKIVAVPAGRILLDEPELLRQAKAAMPHLPFDALDVMIIDRIGKNISGDGADPNITGRYPTPYAEGGPSVNKQVLLDLHDASAGNANGMGTADFVTARLARKVSFAATYPNALTSTVPRPVALPMILPSDRLAIAAAVLTCNAVGRQPRIARIRDTLHLADLWISTALAAEIGSRDDIDIVEEARPFQFDAHGNLVDV